jgi:NDP-sugar pyrophosphorylase family protein
MKQTQGFGPAGETIMEYSIYDAIKAGFKKVIFIIREDFAPGFKAAVEPKLEGKIQTGYVYQQLTSFLPDPQAAEGRVKPWGTAHAILCTKGTVTGPFAVINADDYYGPDAFAKGYQFLISGAPANQHCVIGYELSNTLSENGSVSRGVIDVDPAGNMIDINERTKVYKKDEELVYEEEGGTVYPMPADSKVSMNFFCFQPSFIDTCEQLFSKFVELNAGNPKAEFFLPLVADHIIKSKEGSFKVIPTSAKWFGVTYKEDAPVVKESIEKLVSSGVYPNNLWA